MSGTRYADRAAAGRSLVDDVTALELTDPIVLGVVKGGVVVGRPIADALQAPLEPLLIRKVLAPGSGTVACGAVGEDGTVVLDDERIEDLNLDAGDVAAAVEAEQAEVAAWIDRYRAGRLMTPVAGRDVIVVDDGVATGGSASAGVEVLRRFDPARVIVVVPVAAAGGIDRLEAAADLVVCPVEMTGTFAVSVAYRDFATPDDAEILALLG